MCHKTYLPLWFLSYNLVLVIIFFTVYLLYIYGRWWFKTSNEISFDVNKTGTHYNGTKLLDLTTNATFNKYLNKLNDLNIIKITYTISNFNGPSTQVANASFAVAYSDGNNKVNLGSFSNINFASAKDIETDLVYDSNAANTLARFMKHAQ